MSKIPYYEGKYYLFSNFSAHEVVFLGKTYKTAEHCYQCQKFTDLNIRSKIENATSPLIAKTIAHQHDDKKVSNWDEIKCDVMKKIVYEKVIQHPEVTQVLLDTNNDEIIENSPVDYYWGIGEKQTGLNMMGKVLMAIREKIKNKI